MKWSAISALLVAPLALAGVVAPKPAGVIVPKAVTTFAVTVSGSEDQLIYDPASISGANVGDIVRYSLASGASIHTITQSVEGGDPCVAASGGVDHTFDPGNATSTTFDQELQDASAFHGFCSIPEHCASGMTFSINA